MRFVGLLLFAFIPATSALAQAGKPIPTPGLGTNPAIPGTAGAPGTAVSVSGVGATGGPRDAMVLRIGYFNVSSPASLDIPATSNTNKVNVGFEYDRSFSPRVDFRIGLRLAQNGKVDPLGTRTQVFESFLGVRYYPLSLGTDFKGPIGPYSMRWVFGLKPYVEAQFALGRYLARTFNGGIYEQGSDYYGIGGGAGFKFQLLSSFALDLGFNYQIGRTYSAIPFDPSIIHAYLGGVYSL
jgi:hypothetical protein